MVEPGRPALKSIVAYFGDDVLQSNGRLNRAKLGRMIFEDESKRKVLNACTHPYIQRAVIWEVIKHFLKG